jgi:hypothetical protein
LNCITMWGYSSFGGYGGFGGGFVGGYGPPLHTGGFRGGYIVGARPIGFYSGWFGFHEQWAGHMGWMEHSDYCVWHGWQKMLGGMTMGMGEQRNLLEGMLRQEHGDMNRRELRQLTDRMLEMNKELGAGDDGRVSEVTETTTTTTTTTTSTVSQQQRYDTANDFLQLLTSSGGMGFTLEQAQQKASDIREGRQDTFVTTHLESKAAKASQQTIQAPPQQMQIQPPPPAQIQIQSPPPPPPQPQPAPVQNQQFTQQQYVVPPPQQMQVQSPRAVPQHVQPVYSPPPQVLIQQAQNQLYTTQQTPQYGQATTPQAQHPQFPSQQQMVQSQPVQYQTQSGGSMMQQQNSVQPGQTYQQFNTGPNNMATTSTSTTTTTTESIVSSMQGMSLGTPNQYQVQSPAPRNQYVPHQAQPQIQSPPGQHQYAQQYSQPQPQLQVTYPGFGGQPTQQAANFNQQQPVQTQGAQAQTPQSAGGFFQQVQSPYPVPNAGNQQAPQQMQYAQAPVPTQQWAPSPQANTPQQIPQQAPQQMPQQNPYQPASTLLPHPQQMPASAQQPGQPFNQGQNYKAVQQPPQPGIAQQQNFQQQMPVQQPQAQTNQVQPPPASQGNASKNWLDKNRMGWGKGKGKK